MVRFIILLISFLTLISNYLVLDSHRYQLVLLNDAKYGAYTFSINQLDKINYKYPSLALNSVPILTYVSRYFTEDDQFNYAVEQLKESLNSNPNSLFTKYHLSRNYIFLNDFKNAELYLQQIFDESPKIESATVLYLSILEKNQNFDKLNDIYDRITEIKNKNIWTYYLSAIKNNKKSSTNKLLYSKALIFFQKNF
tara:strand:- start:2070 stop:2657 length:588 start_codon:yes stop_codon:yes gene_type:complete